MPLTERADLTRDEIQALRCYQDIGNPQHNWDIDIPKDETHRDCYVINNALRSVEFRDKLNKHDRDLVDSLVVQIDSAIDKNVVKKDTLVIRGLTNPDFMRKHPIGSEYNNDAYGSYSLLPSVAQHYADLKSSSPFVFVIQDLKQDQNAIYMGGKEQEFLIARGRKYVVSDIQHYVPGELIDDHEAIVYYLTEE